MQLDLRNALKYSSAKFKVFTEIIMKLILERHQTETFLTIMSKLYDVTDHDHTRTASL